MKKILFILILVMASATAFAQSGTKTHKVKKVETIASIARKYGISTSDLILANPHIDVSESYVGAKLTIPSKNITKEDASTTAPRGKNTYSRQGEGTFIGGVEFQYLLFGGGTSDFFEGFRGGMSTDFGYRYYVHHNAFLEGSVGYRWYTYETINKITTTVHNITLPIHVGGYLDVTEKFGLRPFFGPRVDFPVSSRIKYSNFSDSADIKVGVTLEFGLDFQFTDWGIRAKYGLGVGDYKNMNYVSVGIIYGL